MMRNSISKFIVVCIIGIIFQRDSVVDGQQNGLKDLMAGCPGQKSVIRDQKSPNGDSTTEPLVNMVKNAGYSATTYKVETKDGYILSLFRITKPNSSKKNKDPTPVLIIHGLLSSPYDFIELDKKKALAYKLVEDGRDVYLGANRGTTYSQKHKSIPTSDPKFWAFSHIEFGKYDVPAFLDKIQSITKQKKAFYIGHSLGTKQFFTWMSEFPGNCSRVKAMWALAPVAYVNNLKSPPLIALKTAVGPAGLGTKLLGQMEFNQNNEAMKSATGSLCALKGVGCPICQNILYSIGGYGSNQVDTKWQSIQLGHAPDSTSMWNLIHEAQEAFYGRFGYVDLGPVENTKTYGKKYALKPPQLRLENMKTNANCKVHMIYSDNDWLADKTDVKKLKSKLGSVVKSFNKVAYKKFNHFDFVWGKDADTLVYDTILKEMKQYG